MNLLNECVKKNQGIKFETQEKKFQIKILVFFFYFAVKYELIIQSKWTHGYFSIKHKNMHDNNEEKRKRKGERNYPTSTSVPITNSQSVPIIGASALSARKIRNKIIILFIKTNVLMNHITDNSAQSVVKNSFQSH